MIKAKHVVRLSFYSAKGQKGLDMNALASKSASIIATAGLGLSLVGAAILLPVSNAWAAEPASVTQSQYVDGTYNASAQGIGGAVPVTVTVKDGAIASIEVGENSETQGIGSKAIDQLPSLIVAANTTEGVDGVAGATITSKAIFEAVDSALAQALQGTAADEGKKSAEAPSEESAASQVFTARIKT